MKDQLSSTEFFMAYRGVNVLKASDTEYLFCRVDGAGIGVGYQAFSVKDLPVPFGVSNNAHKLIIQNAIDVLRGMLWRDSAESFQQVKAGAWSVDEQFSVEFDISPWLAQASEDQILTLLQSAWSDQSVLLECFSYMREVDHKVSALMSYAQANSSIELSLPYLRVDDSFVLEYLREQNTQLYKKLSQAIESQTEATIRTPIEGSKLHPESCLATVIFQDETNRTVSFDVSFWIEIQDVESLSRLNESNWSTDDIDAIREISKQSSVFSPEAVDLVSKLENGTAKECRINIDPVSARSLLLRRHPLKYWKMQQRCSGELPKKANVFVNFGEK